MSGRLKVGEGEPAAFVEKLPHAPGLQAVAPPGVLLRASIADGIRKWVCAISDEVMSGTEGRKVHVFYY